MEVLEKAGSKPTKCMAMEDTFLLMAKFTPEIIKTVKGMESNAFFKCQMVHAIMEILREILKLEQVL